MLLRFGHTTPYNSKWINKWKISMTTETKKLSTVNKHRKETN